MCAKKTIVQNSKEDRDEKCSVPIESKMVNVTMICNGSVYKPSLSAHRCLTTQPARIPR